MKTLLYAAFFLTYTGQNNSIIMPPLEEQCVFLYRSIKEFYYS